MARRISAADRGWRSLQTYHPRRQSGITLIELLVVMVIIALFATIVGNEIGSWFDPLFDPYFGYLNVVRDFYLLASLHLNFSGFENKGIVHNNHYDFVMLYFFSLHMGFVSKHSFSPKYPFVALKYPFAPKYPLVLLAQIQNVCIWSIV